MQLNFLSSDEYPDYSAHMQDGGLSTEGVAQFRTLIQTFYKQFGRSFTWRQTTDPYHILVSEIMLQQTQTDRVKSKFEQFISTFPTFAHLAHAPLGDVIACWQGLGYNRRALALHRTALRVVQQHGGSLPDSPDILVDFDGIGQATAASICAFAFNQPTLFIETNIRTVYIYTYFSRQILQDGKKIKDSELIPLLEVTLDYDNPRIWYYALMDYGVALKKAFINPSRNSAHHTKQSPFEGSERQIRGMILKVLTEYKLITVDMLYSMIDRQPERIQRNLENLCREGFVKRENNFLSLAGS